MTTDATHLAPAAWSARDRIVVWGIAVACFAAYSLLGVLAHPFLIPGPEWDGYVVRTQDLITGGLGFNESHPFGLPVLLWGLHSFGLEPFAGGRLVSAASGAALAAATYGLLRQWVDRPLAVVGSAIVAVSEVTFLHAILACSDVPATGAMALGIWCWVVVARSSGPRYGLAAAGGLFAGLAASFRFPGAFPAVCALVVVASGGWGMRIKRAAAIAAGFLLGLLPHMWASIRASGTVLGNDNWRNLVLKYQHDFDFEAAFFERDQAATYLSENWPDWLVAGLGDVAMLFWSGLATVFVPSLPTGILVVLSLLMTAVLVFGLGARSAGMPVVAVAGLAAGIATAMTFIAAGRFLLPQILPITVLGLAIAQRLLPGRRIVLVGATLALCAMSWQVPGAVADFTRRHGHVEIPTVKALTMQHDGLCNVQMVTMVDPFLVSAYVTQQPRLPNEASRSSAELWEHVHQVAATKATDYVVVGRAAAPVLVQRLIDGEPPAGYEILRRDDVLIVRCPPPPTAWLTGANVEAVGESLDLTLDINEPDENVLFSYFFVRDAAHNWYPLDLRSDPARPGRYSRRMAKASFPRGELLFVPAFLHRSTAFHHGEPIRARVQ